MNEEMKEEMKEDKTALIRLSLTDSIDNPNFEANRDYALKILNELEEQIKSFKTKERNYI